MPRSPVPPTPWRLEPPPDDHPGDLWAVGADLEPGTLLAAYGLGLFPMPFGDSIGWFSPARRAVVPLAGFAPSRSLRRAARRYEIRVDTVFGEVIRGCARPGDPASWIDAEIVGAYETLHRLGWAHSVEAHDDEGLAGGLYGVALGGLFAAESMFSRRTDASKAAFVALVELLRARWHAGAARARRAVADAAPRLARCGRARRGGSTAEDSRRALPLPDAFV